MLLLKGWRLYGAYSGANTTIDTIFPGATSTASVTVSQGAIVFDINDSDESNILRKTDSYYLSGITG